MHQKNQRILFIATLVVTLGVAAYFFAPFDRLMTVISMVKAASTAQITLPWTYEFRVDGRLDETGSLELSSSPYWWVNSGAYMYLKGGIGSTIHGDLSATNPWRRLYNSADPDSTDNGYHPQNIFRLILRSKWQNVSQEMYSRINVYRLSQSQQRAASNGLLLMSRYQNSDNLYYAGIRVDGYAVIKKKKAGIYYTMAYSRAFASSVYNRTSNPNLLPVGAWIGVKSEVKNLASGAVSIKVYTDVNKTGTWKLVAEAIDDGIKFGGAAITAAGHGGIRTDFMDAEFDDYKLKAL